MSHSFGIVIESLVAVLLLLTIGYCRLLNRRLKRLKADEHSLKATIAELITATEIAERAIAGLKMTVRDCDQNLGDRLRAGETLAGELSRQLEGGRHVLAQLAQITLAARSAQKLPALDASPIALPDAQATAQAAAAFAARARARFSQAA